MRKIFIALLACGLLSTVSMSAQAQGFSFGLGKKAVRLFKDQAYEGYHPAP